jgi:ankyrin repeat protein
MLVKNHANIDARGKNRRTALSLAAEYRYRAVVQLLLDINADITAKDDEGWTAFHYAAERRKDKVMRLLLNQQTKYQTQSKDQAAKHRGDNASQMLLHIVADLRTRESASMLPSPFQDPLPLLESIYALVLSKRKIRIL